MDLEYILFFVAILFFMSGTPFITKKKSEKKYGGQFRTNKGEVVKSKMEMKLANLLHERGIDYHYERRLGPYKPDFYLPRYHLFIEVFGLADLQNKDGNVYRAGMKKKMRYYRLVGVKVVPLLPSDMKTRSTIMSKIQQSILSTHDRTSFTG